MIDGNVNITTLLQSYEITSADLERIRRFGQLLVPQVGEIVRMFYVWIERQPEYHQHCTRPADHVLDALSTLQRSPEPLEVSDAQSRWCFGSCPVLPALV
jgi:hypothetical protein